MLMRVRAASLNRSEFVAPPALNSVGGESQPGGAEAAGEVVALGEGTAGWSIGDRVMGRVRGGFSEYTVIDSREAIPIPARLGWAGAATVPLVFCVVHDLLYTLGRLQPGEWLLVAGIAPGVGIAALQAAKLVGARVIATSGSAEKLDKLHSLGLDIGIYTRSTDFAAKVRKATGGGANLIINNIGGSAFGECLRALAYEGRLATAAHPDGVMTSEIDLQAVHANRLVLFGVSNRLRGPEKQAETVRGFMRDILPALADGRIRPLIDRVFPFDELPAAKGYMVSSAYDGRVGKIVLRMLE
jgi:NADPH:quinone reductase-like Zn-dependent oxidoreductase